MVSGTGSLSLTKLMDEGDDIHPSASAENPVDAGNLTGNLGTVALGQATGGDQELIRPLARGQLAQNLNVTLASPVQ